MKHTASAIFFFLSLLIALEKSVNLWSNRTPRHWHRKSVSKSFIYLEFGALPHITLLFWPFDENSTACHFELKFLLPRFYYEWETVRTIWLLCLKSPEFHDCIKQHYEIPPHTIFVSFELFCGFQLYIYCYWPHFRIAFSKTPIYAQASEQTHAHR